MTVPGLTGPWSNGYMSVTADTNSTNAVPPGTNKWEVQARPLEVPAQAVCATATVLNHFSAQ